MEKNYEKNKKSVEESLFDEVNLKPFSKFLSEYPFDLLREAFNESICSLKNEGDSND